MNQGFENALAMGLQMGSMAAEQRDKREYRNALSQFDPTNADTLKPIMAVRPEVGLQLQGQVREQQAKQQQAQLMQAAIGGDPAALDQLATVNFDAWKSLNAEQKAAAKQEAETYGNAAMDVLRLPPEQRAQAIMGYANRLGSQEIADIAQMPLDQQEQALRAAVAEAGMVQKLLEREDPRYMAIPQGGTLVDTRNPQAVQTFGQQQAQAGGVTEGATATNPQTGEKIVFRNGAWQPMGGAGGNASGGFPPGQ
ncbi:MAG: hypothetical protein ABGX08_17430 [Citromicrobium sp.]